MVFGDILHLGKENVQVRARFIKLEHGQTLFLMGYYWDTIVDTIGLLLGYYWDTIGKQGRRGCFSGWSLVGLTRCMCQSAARWMTAP